MNRLLLVLLLAFPSLCYAGVNVIPLQNSVTSTGNFTSGQCAVFANSGNSGAMISAVGGSCSGRSGGVTSLNSLTGGVTISAGTGITVTVVGNNIVISTSGSGAQNYVTEDLLSNYTTEDGLSNYVTE